MIVNTAKLEVMTTSKDKYPKSNMPEFVLSGRSNVGKSSFINSVLNRKKLAYTSSKPGKTQTLNFYNINEQFYFVDVPGYGYAAVSKEQREKFGQTIEEYLTTRENIKLIFLLVDFRHKPSEDDIIMYDYLKYFNFKVCIIATKSDKVGSTIHKKHEKIIKDALNFDSNDYFIKHSSFNHTNDELVHNLISKYI